MKLSNETKLEMYKTKCKDLTTVNGYIQYYQQFTRNTVENILKLSCLIVEMKEKEQSGELNQSDVDYFCLSVGLKRKGSTFRKFEQIGKHSETFWKYIDKLPDSYTVLYEITTLDPDRFEELMSNNQITSYVTLKDVKRLGNKSTKVNTNKFNSTFTVKFDPKLLDKETVKLFILSLKVLNQLDKKGIVELVIPEFNSKNKFNSSNPFGSTTIGYDGKITDNPEHLLNKPITSEEVCELEESCS